MKRGVIRHAFGNVAYSLTDDGMVAVDDGNQQGLFTGEGIWVSGDLREADPQMCVWVSNQHDPSEVIDPKRQGTVPHLS